MAKDTDVQTTGGSTTALAIPDAAQIREIIEANVGQGGISEFDLDRVRVPAGGGTTWEVPTIDGVRDEKYIEGIIVAWKDSRSYWAHQYDGSKNPPDCSSPDGVTGIGSPGGDCSVCPFAQFGTAVNAQGQNTPGQACKSLRVMFVMQPGRVLPLVVTAPPSSLKPVKNYFLRLASQGVPYYGVTTRLGLVKAQSSGGITYSQIEATPAGRLAAEDAAQWKTFSEAIRPLVSRVVVDAESYSAN